MSILKKIIRKIWYNYQERQNWKIKMNVPISYHIIE